MTGLHSYAAPTPATVTVTLVDDPPGTATGSFTLLVPATPVVTAVSSNVNASASETFTPGQLFSATEAEGFPILNYEVEDETVGGNNGFWVLNGAVLPNGQLTTLTAAQLSQLTLCRRVGQRAGDRHARSGDLGFGEVRVVHHLHSDGSSARVDDDADGDGGQ